MMMPYLSRFGPVGFFAVPRPAPSPPPLRATGGKLPAGGPELPPKPKLHTLTWLCCFLVTCTPLPPRDVG